MTDFKYISIKEFAEEVELSKQAVYKRLEKDLKPYVKVENGFKSISTEALLLFCDNPIECSVENGLKVETEANADVALAKDCFNYTFQLLKEQIETKDKQIAELMKLLAEKDNQPKRGLFSQIFKRSKI